MILHHVLMKRLDLRLDDRLHEALREIAHRDRTSINKLIVAAIEADKGVRLELKRMEK